MRVSAILLLQFQVLAGTPLHAQRIERSPGFLSLAACNVAGVERPARCGSFAVPEDRSVSVSRTIRLNVVVLPATTDSTSTDPLVFLAGGGVVPATRYAAFLARSFPQLSRTRDIVLVDQRGTWNSNPLACDPPSAPPSDTVATRRALERCASTLSAHSNVRAYLTSDAVDDLDALRAWLGYSQLNLYGVSYGTKVAQAYLKKHPERTRAVALYGTVPLSVPFQLELAHSSQRALDLVFSRCDENENCRQAFPRLRAEFDSVLARLQRKPVEARADSAPSSAILLVTDRMFRNVVQLMLGTAQSIGRIPLLVHRAFEGDMSQVVRAVIGDGPPPAPPAPRGVFLTLLCNESVNQINPTDVASATRGSFFGDAPIRFQMAQCDAWPKRSPAPEFWTPARAAVPVLALSGDLDPITPPRYADSVVTNLRRTPNTARHIMLRNRSHGDIDPCITTLIEQFLLRPDVTALDARCADIAAPLVFQSR